MFQTKQTASKPLKLDLKTLRQQQLDGEQPQTQKGNTPEGADYDVPVHELDRVHVRLTKRVNNPEKREYEDQVTVKKFVPAQYDRMVANNYFDVQTYDKIEVLHDPRRAAGAKPAQTTEPTGAKPWEPVPGLPTLQDAQVRYQQLTNMKAPAVGYEELIAVIKVLEASTGEHEVEDNLGEQDDKGAGTAALRKVIRSTADAQARYKELFNEDAPADKGFAELKTLIEAKEAESDQK